MSWQLLVYVLKSKRLPASVMKSFPISVRKSFLVASRFCNEVKFPISVRKSFLVASRFCNEVQAASCVSNEAELNINVFLQVPLLIPCHRVINSSGQSGTYMGGTGNHLKEWLLRHERP